MLKGRTKIELTDVNTGEVTVHEDENMFTQSVYDHLNNGWTQMLGGLSTLKSWHLPIVTKLLGGVALFADSIDEKEEQTLFPEDNEVLGYAGDIASDGSTKFWGSRNFLESEAYDPETRSVKYVWDFGTSQGNGTIKAIGMIPPKQANYYGDSMWNIQHNRYLDASGYFSPFGMRIVEFEGDEVVWMQNGVGEVTINRSRFELSKITLNETLGTNTLVSSKKVALPNTGTNYCQMYWKDGGDGYWYGFLNFSNNSFTNVIDTTTSWTYFNYRGSYYLQLVRISKETFQMEYHNITVPSYYVSDMGSNPIITKNYVIMTCSSNGYWYSYGTSDCNVCNVRKDRLCFISKHDWTVSIRNNVDDKGQQKFLFPNSYSTNQCYYFNQIFNTAYSLKLPNGTYQLNDFILDDDGIVINQIAGPIASNTGIPTNNVSDTNTHYIFPFPFAINYQSYSSGYNYYRCWGLIINKKKKLLLWIGSYSNSFKYYVAPLDCQDLITINNLAEPVTKSSTQSMKITYTVTDTDSYED